MPITKSAKKELRKSKKRRLINKTVKLGVKKLVKDSKKLIEAKEVEKANELIRKSIKAIDKAVKKGVLKKNTGNRKKSRLMKKYNKAAGIGKKNKKE